MFIRIHHFITVLALLLFVATGCDEVLQGISEEQQSEPSSLTVTRDTEVSSSDNGSAADKASESAVYDFNDLSKACVEDYELPSTYRDLEFEQAPRWPVCLAYPSTEGHDGMAIMPIDSRLHHKNNNGTTLLADDRIRLPEPADSVSLVTANHDRPLVNYITQRNYASWLVAYDEEANEIDRALNSRGGHTGVELIVRGSSETPIHMIGIETYPQSTYFDNLTVWKAKTVLPDETPPHFNYTVETDTLFPADRQLHLAVSDIYASDDRGGTVTMTVSVASSESEISRGDPTSPDWKLVDNGDGSVHVYLRAEHSASTTGRAYTISLRGIDASGNVAEKSIEIVVPLNLRNKDGDKIGDKEDKKDKPVKLDKPDKKEKSDKKEKKDKSDKKIKKAKKEKKDKDKDKYKEK